MILGLPLTDIAVFWLACLAAYALKGFSGFGSALIFIPVTALVFDPRTALAASPFVDLFVGLAMLASLRPSRGDLPVLTRMIGFLVLGTLVGANLAGILPGAVLLALIGVAVLLLGLHLWLTRPPTESGTLQAPGTGLWLGCAAGGLTGGLVGISGPPIVAAARRSMDKSSFRRLLTALFLVECGVKLGVYACNGVWTAQVPEVALLAAPAIVLGLAIGYRTHVSVSERAFNLVIGSVLLLLALRVLHAAWRQLV